VNHPTLNSFKVQLCVKEKPMGLAIVASLVGIALISWAVVRTHKEYKQTRNIQAQAIEGQQKGIAIAEKSHDDWQQAIAVSNENQKRILELAEENLAIARKQLQAQEDIISLLKNTQQKTNP
jgi:hypothetical protein